VTNHNYGSQCYIARNFDCAIDRYVRTIETAPYPNAYRGMALIYAQKRMPDEALQAILKAVALAPDRTDLIADLAYVQAMTGQKELARVTLERARKQPLEGFSIARAYVALGDADSAFAWLERSNWRWPHRAARGDPALDPLRSDPRFAQLVERVDREMGIR
jgi:Flp pilus assembly protein TadD